jgi:hypothetical protein
MREETERQFRRLLEQHDRELLRSHTPSSHRALRQEEFDRQFHERVTAVVKPVMASLQALMHDHDLRSEIVVTQRRTETDGKITPSCIEFQFCVLTDPETHGFPVTTPSLTVIADPGNGLVLIHENSILPFLGGHVGIIDQCALDDLTAERIETHLLSLARKVLRETGAS